MKPKRIILIRHGESEGNLTKKVYGVKPDYALELTETGIHQAQAAGGKLKEIVGDESLFFYVSPMWRTRMTFEEIVSSFDIQKIQWTEEPRLREQEWGHLRNVEECKTTDDARDAYGTFYYRIPDGESAADVYDRVSDFFGTLHRDFEKTDFPQNAVIITHGMTIRLFLMRWFKWTVEEFEKKKNLENCQIVIMENHDGRYKLLTELKEHKVVHSYQRPVNLTGQTI